MWICSADMVLLGETGEDGFADLGSEEVVAFALEVDVVGILQFGEPRGDRAEQVVGRDAVLLHHLGREGVLLHDRLRGLLLGRIVRDRRGARPDELGAGLLETADDFFESLDVVGGRGRPVMDAEIEMDDVPFGISKPGFEIGEAIGGGLDWLLRLRRAPQRACHLL